MNGDCYQVAANFIINDFLHNEKSTLKLIHGEVTGQGPVAGIKFGHAWTNEWAFKTNA